WRRWEAEMTSTRKGRSPGGSLPFSSLGRMPLSHWRRGLRSVVSGKLRPMRAHPFTVPCLGIALLLAVAPGAIGQDEAWRRAGWCRSEYAESAPPPRLNLPAWACKVAADRRMHETYDVHEAMNPFFLSGDFDGDGQADLAVWISNRRSKQLGVA